MLIFLLQACSQPGEVQCQESSELAVLRPTELGVGEDWSDYGSGATYEYWGVSFQLEGGGSVDIGVPDGFYVGQDAISSDCGDADLYVEDVHWGERRPVWTMQLRFIAPASGQLTFKTDMLNTGSTRNMGELQWQETTGDCPQELLDTYWRGGPVQLDDWKRRGFKNLNQRGRGDIQSYGSKDVAEGARTWNTQAHVNSSNSGLRLTVAGIHPDGDCKSTVYFD